MGQRRIGAGVLVLTAACAVAGAAAAADLKAIEDSVVRVVVAPEGGGEGDTGSGFRVGAGFYVTNRHVVERSTNSGYHIWVVPSTPGAHATAAQAIMSDSVDLALLKVDGADGQALTLSPQLPDAGQGVTALGYPGQMDALLQRAQLDQPAAPDVTVGALINHGRMTLDAGGAVTQIVHSASVWPGNSGGPLVDRCGRIIGINTWVHAENGLAQQNIAISAADIIRFLADNQVTPAVDNRMCADGVLGSGPAPSPPAEQARTPSPGQGPAQAASERPASAAFGGLILISLLVAGIAAGAYELSRRRRISAAKLMAMEERADEW